MASLGVVRSPDRMPLSIPLLKSTTVIGRQPSSDVALMWDGISRVHSRILGTEPDGSGLYSRWRILDEGGGSNNGTFVNGERVSEKELRDGDIIGFGKGRSIPFGGGISDAHLEYVLLFKTVVTKPPVPKGKLATGMADKGAHRHLRGPDRHPLGGHSVAGVQKEKRHLNAELPAGELVPPCKSMVYPPSGYAPSKADHRPPSTDLQLEFVYGYRGHDVKDSVHYVDSTTVIYPAGAMVVKLDMATNTQTFFKDHDDDVVCVAICPNRKFVASGQVASRVRRDPETGRPTATVLVWDARTMRRNIEPPTPKGGGWTSRGVLGRVHLHTVHALDFDPSTRYLVTFGGDQNLASAICVYDWRKGTLWFKLPAGCSMVNCVRHNPFTSSSHFFVQAGNRNLRYWRYELARVEPEQSFSNAAMLKHTGGQPCGVNCVTFLDTDTTVAAMDNGAIFLFGVLGAETTVLEAVPGKGGPKAHVGAALCVVWDARIGLVSSGQDGYVRVWDFEWREGKFSRPPIQTKQVSVQPFAVRGFQRACAVQNMDMLEGKLICGTTANIIMEIDVAAMEQTEHDVKHRSVRVVHQGHTGESRRDKQGILLPSLEVKAVATFPDPNAFLIVTVGEDASLRLWHTGQRRTHKLVGGKEAVAAMGMQGACVDVSLDCSMIAVGHPGGVFTVWDAQSLKCVLQNNYRREPISVVRFDPSCRYLAVGSQEQSIDIYDVANGCRRIGNDQSRHTASITHMDWSADGQFLRSTDNAATLLYWYTPNLKPFTDHTGFFRDTRWATDSVVLGWDRKHIFGPGYSINDCNSVTVSPNKVALVAGYDTGDLRLYPYPAISPQMPCIICYGHCCHVMGVKFTHDNRYLISVGGQDLCVFQWRHIQTAGNHALKAANKLGGIAMRANDT